MKAPKLTVVMPTLNRPDVLPRTLGYLAEQDFDPSDFEVIVIEDGCTEGTRQAMEGVQGSLPYDVTFLQNEEGHRGPGFTQNRGIRAARGALTLLLADDIFLAPHALRAHVETHERHAAREVAVLGKAVQSPEMADQSTFLRYWDPWGFADMSGERELPWYMFWACNVSFKTEFVLSVDAFREHRGRSVDGKGSAAHEDVDLGYRLRDKGLRIIFQDQAFGYHYHVYTLEQAIARYYQRGVNWEEFYQHVPAPELLVHNHVLTPETWREYLRVLDGKHGFTGKEASAPWHVVRHLLFLVLLNRVTAPLLWKPMLDLAERSAPVAGLMNRQIYRAYLYFQFMRGVRAGYRNLDTSARQPQPS